MKVSEALPLLELALNREQEKEEVTALSRLLLKKEEFIKINAKISLTDFPPPLPSKGDITMYTEDNNLCKVT